MSNTPQIIIPMTGLGQRFIDAGYHHLKPLIPIGNSRIINEVMNMFPGIVDPLFIIAEDHKQKNELLTYLKDCWPQSTISEIPQHKLGPGYAIFKSKNFIDKNRPVIVSYCDFGGNWNYEKYCNELNTVDGLILTYTGFNPHMLRNTKYAYVRKNAQGAVIDIQEKNSFSDFPLAEEASAGLYGFASGQLLIDSLDEQINMNYSHFGEYYMSLTYISLLNKGLTVKTFLMDKFMQFGTPEDLNDWVCLYRSINNINEVTNSTESVRKKESVVVLAGGLGSRLSERSNTPKPFVLIRGKPLWKISMDAAIMAAHKLLILNKELNKNNVDVGIINGLQVEVLEKLTDGQADTARISLKTIPEDSAPVTFLSCDNLIKKENYELAIERVKKVDLVVWTTNEYPPASYKPERYSWVDVNKGSVTRFSLKNLPKNFRNPSMVIGNFTFQSKKLAENLINDCFKSSDRYNSEIYLDSVIQIALESGHEVGVVNLDEFFAVGTEEEWDIFHYYSTLKMQKHFKIN